MNGSILFVVDRPYYPSVTPCKDRAEAEALCDEWVSNNHADDGHHTAKVYIVEVLDSRTYKTYS